MNIYHVDSIKVFFRNAHDTFSAMLHEVKHSNTDNIVKGRQNNERKTMKLITR